MEFRNTSLTYELVDEGTKALSFSLKKRVNAKRLNLLLTFYREMTKNGETIRECNTHVKEIKVEQLKHHIFIQLDKPIYKPGDAIQFRIIVLDDSLMQLRVNNIDVKIIDPFGRVMYVFNELEDIMGVFINNYKISPNAALGDWTMTAVVDKQHGMKRSKIFSLSKDTLPLFNLYLRTSSKNYLPHHKLTISFNARYSSGDYVVGRAELVITDTINNKTCYKKEFKSSKAEKIDLDFRTDLGVTVVNQMNLEASVTFTEQFLMFIIHQQ